MNNKNTVIDQNLTPNSNYLLTFSVEESLKNKEISINIINLKNFSAPEGHPYVPPPTLNSETDPNFVLKEDDFYLLQDNGFKIKLEESPS